MRELKIKILIKMAIIWSLIFIIVSVCMTFIFSPTASYVFLLYHIPLFPIYILITGILITGYWQICFLFRFNDIFKLVFFIIIVILISMSLRDFQESFGFGFWMKYQKPKEISLHRIINSGNREMFNFISLAISSIIMFVYIRQKMRIEESI